MSGDSGSTMIPNLVNSVQNPIQAVGNFFSPPKAPQLHDPNSLSHQPTIQQANTTAIQNQLAKEKMATSTTLMGGQGLMDEPTTTSQTLKGY